MLTHGILMPAVIELLLRLRTILFFDSLLLETLPLIKRRASKIDAHPKFGIKCPLLETQEPLLLTMDKTLNTIVNGRQEVLMAVIFLLSDLSVV